MAHANPEFALGLMRPDRAPVRFETPAPATLAQLRARMAQLDPSDPRVTLWHAARRASRPCGEPLADAITPPKAGMHAGGKAGERFIEPKRRWPQDVQRGRERVSRIGTVK